jgi:hypothetical protein
VQLRCDIAFLCSPEKGLFVVWKGCTLVILCPYLFLADKVVPPLSIAKSLVETLQGVCARNLYGRQQSNKVSQICLAVRLCSCWCKHQVTAYREVSPTTVPR